ncbi:hypothetical protein A1D22_02585 [Pasteurellaceae bacterium LFhippo2]|nr:hypothetical protein [Pasteurellaceae bacterium LFhippo2]
MTFQEEQDRFKREIADKYISIYDLVNKVMAEQQLDFKTANLFILTRINDYLSRNNNPIFYTLTEPPFTKYELEELFYYTVIDCLQYAHNNGRYRSEKKAKTYGILIAEINLALYSTFSDTVGNTPNERKYNPIERTTHLQMIAMLAEELAKHCKKYRKANGLPNNYQLAQMLEETAKEISLEHLTPKSLDGYRRRLTEISKYYKGEGE